MGVMTVSSQNFMGIDMPGWWLSGASVDLDFRNGRYYDSSNILAGLPNLLSISRASIGYAKTSGGTLTQFSSGQFRQTDAGVLIEDARTNLAQNSQTLDLDGIFNVSVTANAFTAVDGTATADQFTEGSGTTTAGINCPTFTITTATDYAVSCWVKAINRNYCYLSFMDAAQGNKWATQIFDLQNGVLGESAVGSLGGSKTSAFIEAYSGGWFRCSLVAQLNVTSAQAVLGPAPVASGNSFDGPSGNVRYTLTNGLAAITAWGLQAELGSFPSSYIPTTTTSATRAADAVTVTGTLNAILSALPHSEVMDLITSVSATGFVWSFCADDTDNVAHDLTTAGTAGNAVDTAFRSNISGNEITGTFVTSKFSTGVKIGNALAAGAHSVVGDGGTVVTDTNAAAMGSGNIFLGSGAAAFRTMFGYIRRFTVWNSKLADATLQAMTR